MKNKTEAVSHHHQSFALFWKEQRKSGKKADSGVLLVTNLR